MFIPEGPEVVPSVVQALTTANLDTKRVQLLGTGLWDDPRIFNNTALHGGWYAAPDSTGFRNFSARYRQRYNQDPVRTATCPTTRSRWWRRWSRRRGRNVSPSRC